MAYDSKAVKVGKSIKMVASNILDSHERGDFIRLYVRIAQADARGRSIKNQPKAAFGDQSDTPTSE